MGRDQGKAKGLVGISCGTVTTKPRCPFHPTHSVVALPEALPRGDANTSGRRNERNAQLSCSHNIRARDVLTSFSAGKNGRGSPRGSGEASVIDTRALEENA